MQGKITESDGQFHKLIIETSRDWKMPSLQGKLNKWNKMRWNVVDRKCNYSGCWFGSVWSAQCLPVEDNVVLLSAPPGPFLHVVQDRAVEVAVPTHTEATQLSLVSTVICRAGLVSLPWWLQSKQFLLTTLDVTHMRLRENFNKCGATRHPSLRV